MDNETVTKAIFNKGFKDNSSILPRSNFCSGGQSSKVARNPLLLIASKITSKRSIQHSAKIKRKIKK